MITKKLSLIIGIIYLTFIFSQYLQFSIYHPGEKINLSFVIDQLGSLIVFVLIGVVIGAISALVPFKNKLFYEKFKITFPFAMVIVISLMTLSSFHILYLKKAKGIDLTPLKTIHQK